MLILEGKCTLPGTCLPNGISPDPDKIKKVKDFPVRTDVNKVRQFLGLASYYRRFIPNFAKVANPLHSLTKKKALFEWTTQCQEVFQTLMDLLTTAPVLVYPEFGNNAEFVLETDASTSGLAWPTAERWSYPSNCIHIQVFAAT